MTRAARSAAAEDGPPPERLPEAGAPASQANARIWHAPQTGPPESGTPVDGPESGTPIEALRLTEEDNDALQRLGVAVLAHAVNDAVAPPLAGLPGRNREVARGEAVRWLLRGSHALQLWAQLAGLDADAVASRVRERLPERAMRAAGGADED